MFEEYYQVSLEVKEQITVVGAADLVIKKGFVYGSQFLKLNNAPDWMPLVADKIFLDIN